MQIRVKESFVSTDKQIRATMFNEKFKHVIKANVRNQSKIRKEAKNQ